jgi:glyoxylase-like metal-dependent hydrolase (beta-lactamase superfamily II)
MWNAKFVLAGLAMGLALAGPAAGQPKPLKVQIVTSSPGSLNTNFTLVMGEKEAVLIDAPFLKSDAHRLVGDILDSGKTLKAIFVTHMHPDHFFGLAVLKDAFPEVQVYAQPQAAAEFERAYANRLAFWGPQIGANAPSRPVAPTPYAEKTYTLEGQPIELIGPVQGDAAVSTLFWVPSARAVICGDVVFNQSVPGLFGQGRAQRAAWVAALDRILALQPDIVVAGHTRPGAPATRAAVDYTRGYLVAFERAVDASRTPEEVVSAVTRAYPEAGAPGFTAQGLAGAAQAAIKEKLGPGAPR